MFAGPQRPFHSAIGAMVLAIGVPVLLLASMPLFPQSSRTSDSRLARIPRFHSRQSSPPALRDLTPAEPAADIQIADRTSPHLSGSVALSGDAAPAAEASRAAGSQPPGAGIRIASRDPDSVEFGSAQDATPAVPVPDWVADVEPLAESPVAKPEPTDSRPSVTLDVLPFDVRTAAAQASRSDDEWRDRVKSLETRLDAVFSDRLEQHSRQFEAAARRLERFEEERRLQVLENGLQELRTAAEQKTPVVEPAPQAIQLDKSAAEPPLFDLEARQAETGEVFRQIALAAGVEIVVSPAVQGRVSVILKQKSLEELLALLASSQSCVVERDAAIWRVQSTTEAAARASRLPEPEARTFVPRHVSARELAEFLRPLLTPEVGQISAMEAGPAADETAEPHGTLLVRDRPEVVSEVERKLRQFDVPLVEVDLTAQVFSVDLTGTSANGVTLTGRELVKRVPIPCPICGGSHETVSALTTVESPAGEFLQAPGGLKYAFVKGDGRAVVAMLSHMAATHPIGVPRVRVRNRQPVELVLSSLAPLAAGEVDGAERRLRVRPAALPTGEFQLVIEERHPHPHAGTAVLSADVKLREGTTVLVGGIVESAGSTHREILILLTPRIRGSWPVAEGPQESSARK